MSSVTRRPTHERAEHRPRKAGTRRVSGIAGRPLKLSNRKERRHHAVQRRPPLRERLATRVKQQTRRLDEHRPANLPALLGAGLGHLRQAVLPHDPRDAERLEQSGEPVVALVGAVDLTLLLAVVALLVVGTVMVYSASLVYAVENYGTANYYLIRQVEWLTLGAIGMYVAIRVDYHVWRLLAGAGVVMSILLLLLMHTHRGVVINGSRRWLELTSFIVIEPSEFAKMGLILYAAHWFANQRPALRHSLRGLIPFGCVIGAVVALVFKEPDLGTTAVIAVALLTVYFVAGARWRHLALLAGVAAVGFKLYLRHLPTYQLSRYLAFLDPQAQAETAGWHYLQLRYALGMGGLTGVGLGNSQAKYTIFMPHTDSIFAILGEEWGVVGTLGVLCLFLFFAMRGLRASILAPDMFGRLLAVGLTGAIVFQALLNMAVVANLLPFTGVPLPFISYGGSSLSISMVAAGILLNVSKQAINLKEERNPASTYFWWRNRRPHLPVTGRARPALARPAGSGHHAAFSARRPGER